MRIITGDSTGLYKTIQLENEQIISKFGEQQKDNDVVKMIFSNKNEDGIISVNKANIVNQYCLDQNGEHQYDFINYDLKKKDKCVGLNIINEGQKLLINYEDGKLEQLQLDYENGNFKEQKQIFDFKFKQIQNSKLNDYNINDMVVLSKDTPVRIYDIEKGAISFKSKNVKNDYLDLKVPIYDTDVTFLCKNTFYVSTAYSKIRFYDIRQKQQAISDYEFTTQKSYINCIRMDHQQQNIMISNNIGNVYLLDKINLQKNQINKQLKCGNSSITDICMHPKLNMLSVVSMDRYLRVFNFDEEYEQTNKIYMKHKLNKVLVSQQDYDEDNIKKIQKINQDNKLEAAQKLKKRKTLKLYATADDREQNKDPLTKRIKQQ